MSLLVSFSELFGRLHPMLLHIPIGMFIGLGFLELVNIKRGAAPASMRFLWIAALGAVVVAGSGWVLHQEDGYASSFVLRWHERLGIATAVGAVLSLTLRHLNRTKFYRVSLFLTLGVMGAAGHFGSEMTHGKGFLLEPFEESGELYVPQDFLTDQHDQPITVYFEQSIAPLLKARCVKCHGPRKSKADLRLDSVEGILAGGENGAIINSALASESEIYRRLLLPIEHDDHMPPESKTQCTSSEIELLRIWLAAGAPFEQGFALGDGMDFALDTLPDDAQSEMEEIPEVVEDPAYDLAVEVLRQHLVHVQVIEPGSKMLWVDFAAVAEHTDDSMVVRLLTPLTDYVSDLSLARCLISNDIMDFLADMPHLTQLNLGQTALSDSGLASFTGHQELQQLRVPQTLVTESSFPVFESLPALTDLWIWETGIVGASIATLRAAQPQVIINAGDSFQVEPLEVEPDLVFSSDAPLVDALASDLEDQKAVSKDGVSSLTPSNDVCPITGKPVDPRYAVVFEGKVIGFCCPSCPKTFWEDPTKFQ